jgi:hypothetical protein
LDTAYPADTAIEIIRDNHTAHVSREITAWLAAQPPGRFTFTFTPTHASWLTPIEGFLSKLARSMLRPIRVASKHELKKRLLAFIDDLNREPILHSWRYKIDNTADRIGPLFWKHRTSNTLSQEDVIIDLGAPLGTGAARQIPFDADQSFQADSRT